MVGECGAVQKVGCVDLLCALPNKRGMGRWSGEEVWGDGLGRRYGEMVWGGGMGRWSGEEVWGGGLGRRYG